MPTSAPLRVLHIVPALFGHGDGVVGGAERYALELARHMADVTPTRLLAFGDLARTERVGALEIRVAGPSWHVRGQRTNPVARGLLAEVLGADVVHCHQQHVVASSLAAAIARIAGRRTFVTDLGGGGWDVSGYISTDRWFHGHLHISAYSRDVAGHGGWKRARVILGGVDTERFSPDAEVPRSRTALFVGRILPHKGLDDLITGIPPDVPLEVVGPAPDASYLAHLQTLAAGRPVRFRHGCDDAELVDAYRRAVCVVLPSVYRTAGGAETRVPELLGQTLLEAMACGTPVIATQVASLPEVVSHEETGFLVPPNDPAALGERIGWLTSHPTEARAMGAAGRRRVLERFTWPSVVHRCLEAYHG